MPDQFIRTTDDVLTMLDGLLAQTSDRAWWDEFFADRSRRCPFLVDWPDESLAGWFGDGLLTPGRVLELGCGNGRNAAYLASLGCRVDAVDFSAQAIEARTARHAYWFPLVLFGLLSCASVPFYISATTPPATGVAILRPSAGPSLLGGVMPGRNGNLLGWYWAAALLAGYLLTYAWYRRHTRRVGLRAPARAVTITGIALAALAFLGPMLVANLPFRNTPAGLPLGDLWMRGTFAFLIAAAGLWVLAWAERSRALAVITLAYTGAALLASLYDVENLLYRLGWSPGPGGAVAMLPNVLLPALVLLAGGAGAFFLRPRPAGA